ncbi:hypothetical protein UCDDS831_g00950 [Diplodia seriata]|uniref:Uncharacterized protein n=1 Tax=Diplodia seriata TaxID=420778 RepID=A0A0G2EYE3_9PEZI|nr:hypothetical protein UCDDS831_g00950 [Diplodia seriata]
MSLYPKQQGPGSKQQRREPPRTPPNQQLYAYEPSAPRKRPAPHHEDLSVFQPARKRKVAVVEARKPYLGMDVHVKENGGLVAISPTGTICRCHLKPGSICHHEMYEPHVDNYIARAQYESLSPIKQVMERRRVNQLKERENREKELQMDVKAISKEGPEFVRSERRRERRARQNSSIRDTSARDKFIYVTKEYANLEGFIVDDSDVDSDGDEDESGDEGGYVESSDSDDGEDAEDVGDSEDEDDGEGDDDLEENEDHASEYIEDDGEEDGEEGGNDYQSSLADDEEIPYLPKPEPR